MTIQPEESNWLVDELIRLVNEKMEDNRPLLARSLNWGRLSWRMGKRGKIEVDLEPKV
jgi:hypothetical protein